MKRQNRWLTITTEASPKTELLTEVTPDWEPPMRLKVTAIFILYNCCQFRLNLGLNFAKVPLIAKF